MQLEDFAPPDSIPGVAYTIAGILAATIIIFKVSKGSSLRAIPTVGSSGWLGSWWAGYKFQMNAAEVIKGGYEKYKSTPFKVADRYHWIVVLGGRQHIEELRSVPEDVLSFHFAASHLMQMQYTMGPELVHNTYHVEVIRTRFSRNLTSLSPELHDEISVTFDEILDLRGSEWRSVHALDAIQKVACRTNNRVFVGLPLCRNPDWVDINLRYTRDIPVGAHAILSFPSFLAPFVAYFVTDLRGTTERAMTYLAPIIKERMKLREEYGNDWAGMPNDLLTWLMDEAPEGPDRTTRLLTARILFANFSAIHTTASSFCQTLFLLAENPQYVQPLREEVESVVEKEGWSRASLGKMRKIDSFLRESQRLVGISAAGLIRKALQDFTFSDGTFIPKGTFLVVAAQCLQCSNENYDNALVFNPFRFSDIPDEGGGAPKCQLTSTSADFLSFGYGKYACPGRFLASNVLKFMLAHIVVSYDVKLEGNKTWSNEPLRNGAAMMPDPTAKVMFRRRAR